MQSQQVFITGATGILGSWVLGNALAKGYGAAALMRDSSEDAARVRLRQALSVAGCADKADDVQILLGDVSQPDLGLSARQRDAVRAETQHFIHCAASVSFDPTKGEDTKRINVQGTQHVLDVVRDTDVSLYHVSTAYVAGRHEGLWREADLARQQQFHNAYEESKSLAEQTVQSAFREGQCQGAIFRPAIIVGAARNGRIAQFLNFYGFLRLMEAAAEGRIASRGPIRLGMDPQCTKNLVPVDWTAAALWKIIDADGPSGLTYNLTHPNPLRVRDLVAWANARLHGTGTYFDATPPCAEASPIERVAHLQLRHYMPYLKVEPEFDRSNTDRALNGALAFPKTDASYFDRILEYARSQSWRAIFAQQPRASRRLARVASERPIMQAAG